MYIQGEISFVFLFDLCMACVIGDHC